MNRFEKADRMLHECWNMLLRAAGPGRDAFGTPVIGTVDPEAGYAGLRTVILRKVMPSRRELWFYSDARSEKIGQLQAAPRISCHFYDPARQLQIRGRGLAALHFGDELARQQWEEIGIEGRTNYASVEPPARPAAESTRGLPDFWSEGMPLEQTEYAFQHFALVVVTVEAMDCLLLHPDGHQRVIFQWEEAAGDWRGGWVIP